MKHVGLIAALGFLLVVSAQSPADTTPPTPQESKAETFLLVEVKGAIGGDFTAAKMKAAISEARTAKVAAIVLSMDTPGGSVPDAEAIVNLIIENKDLRFIALVNKALSAGAAITLACKEIYVMETATIGAAVSYIPDKRGIPVELPADVAEKFQSAWRAVCRKAADCGGHSSLLAEGMADPGFAITKRSENGKVILERDGKGELIKAAGRILTLTAKEAVACGLAKAVAPDVKGLGAKLGMPNWRQLGGIDTDVEDDRPILRLPELSALVYQYLTPPADATLVAVRAHQEEVMKKLIARNVELSGKLVNVGETKEGLAVMVRYESPKKAPSKYYWPAGVWSDGVAYGRGKSVGTQSVETIDISMMSANRRWISAKTGSRIVVTGRIRDMKIAGENHLYTPPVLLRMVHIAMVESDPKEATSQTPAQEPKSTASAPPDPEAEARSQLSLAENYRRAGLASKALGILRSIIKDFPNTAAAKEAAEQVKELEDDAKKARKGS